MPTAAKRIAKMPKNLGVTRGTRHRALGTPSGWVTVNLDTIYSLPALDRVTVIRAGVPASELTAVVAQMGVPKTLICDYLRLPRATIDRQIKNGGTLSPDHSERLIGLERLIGQVSAMIRESGGSEGFDSAKWVAHWIDQPVPALGGRRPGELLDTIEGQQLVSKILAQSQSGAYA